MANWHGRAPAIYRDGGTAACRVNAGHRLAVARTSARRSKRAIASVSTARFRATAVRHGSIWVFAQANAASTIRETQAAAQDRQHYPRARSVRSICSAWCSALHGANLAHYAWNDFVPRGAWLVRDRPLSPPCNQLVTAAWTKAPVKHAISSSLLT